MIQKSRRELEEQIALYLNQANRQSVEPSSLSEFRSSIIPRPSQQHMVPATREHLASSKPLRFSELRALLFTLSDANALLNFKVASLERRSQVTYPQTTPQITELGTVVLHLLYPELSQMNPDFLSGLEAQALIWRHEPQLGDTVTMELAIEESNSHTDWVYEENELRQALVRRKTAVANFTFPDPVYTKPNKDDPPGVQLGLVKKLP